MDEFIEQLNTLLEGLLQSYKDALILRFQEGYEDSGYRTVAGIEDVDIVNLVETDSLEVTIIEQFFEELSLLQEELDIEIVWVPK